MANFVRVNYRGVITTLHTHIDRQSWTAYSSGCPKCRFTDRQRS